MARLLKFLNYFLISHSRDSLLESAFRMWRAWFRQCPRQKEDSPLFYTLFLRKIWLRDYPLPFYATCRHYPSFLKPLLDLKFSAIRTYWRFCRANIVGRMWKPVRRHRFKSTWINDVLIQTYANFRANIIVQLSWMWDISLPRYF